ncbi:MAG: hypothetical protein HY704_14305 [Gemmatimonadetes bacterium]|nr:hypothetical protein [Gemmatimonadota bacterium]
MREFVDEQGRRWRAGARREPVLDFKGRWYLAFQSLDGAVEVEPALRDVRWNSRQTAERTLATMAEVELCRRLHWALGRTPVGAGSS